MHLTAISATVTLSTDMTQDNLSTKRLVLRIWSSVTDNNNDNDNGGDYEDDDDHFHIVLIDITRLHLLSTLMGVA